MLELLELLLLCLELRCRLGLREGVEALRYLDCLLGLLALRVSLLLLEEWFLSLLFERFSRLRLLLLMAFILFHGSRRFSGLLDGVFMGERWRLFSFCSWSA